MRRTLVVTEPASKDAVRSTTASPDAVMTTGTITSFDSHGIPIVSFVHRGCARTVAARRSVNKRECRRGVTVILLLENADFAKPIIVGVVHGEESETEAVIDGERLVLTAENEIVLKCGNASLTLTRAGKVLIQGAYVLSRSSGVNRIKGGSVQIN